jgi:hypothetical protein
LFDAILPRAVEAIPSGTSPAQEPGVAENAQMLRDRRPRDVRKSSGDLDDGKLPRADEPQDLAPMRLGDGFEGEVREQ